MFGEVTTKFQDPSTHGRGRCSQTVTTLDHMTAGSVRCLSWKRKSGLHGPSQTSCFFHQNHTFVLRCRMGAVDGAIPGTCLPTDCNWCTVFVNEGRGVFGGRPLPLPSDPASCRKTSSFDPDSSNISCCQVFVFVHLWISHLSVVYPEPARSLRYPVLPLGGRILRRHRLWPD